MGVIFSRHLTRESERDEFRLLRAMSAKLEELTSQSKEMKQGIFAQSKMQNEIKRTDEDYIRLEQQHSDLMRNVLKARLTLILKKVLALVVLIGVALIGVLLRFG